MKTITLLATAILTNLFCLAQQPGASVYELGKPFEFKLFMPEKFAQKPLPGDSLGGFEILTVNDSAGTGKAYLKVMLLPVDTGRQLLPMVWHPQPDNRQYTPVMVSLPPNHAMLQYQPPLEIVDLYPDKTDSPANNGWWVALALLLLAVAGWLWWRQKKKADIHHAPQTNWDAGALLTETRRQWQSQNLSSMQLGENLIKILHQLAGAAKELTVQQLYNKMQQAKLKHQIPDQTLLAMLAETDAWRFGRQVAATEAGLQHIDMVEHLWLAKQDRRKYAE